MSNAHLNVGATLQSGKYRIIHVLGHGGFGITYLATSSQANKQVAVKEFFPSGYCERNVMTGYVSLKSDVSKYKTKFTSEAKKISQLNHKGIVKVIEVFEENGTAYYVMDYIKGKSLLDLIRIKPYSVDESIDIIRNIAEALKHIHSKRMLHLDIKPMNIMIRDSDNLPIVIDFGISKTYDVQGNPNTTFMPGASLGYSSPEQLDGEVNMFAPQLDIYSLGATFYSLLTGKLPSYPTPSTTSKLQFTPETPASIIAVVVKAMAYYQKDRYTTMAEFIKALPPKAAKGSTSAQQTCIKTSENAPSIRSFQIFNEVPYGVGQNITIKWSVKDGDELFLNGRKVDGINKSKVIKYKTVGEKRLTLKAKNAYGEVSKSLTFYVQNLNSKPKATEETQIIADVIPDNEDIQIKKNIYEVVSPIIAKQIKKDVGHIHPSDNLIINYGLDSLDAVDLILELEKVFNINIEDEKAEKIRTVSDIIDLIYSYNISRGQIQLIKDKWTTLPTIQYFGCSKNGDLYVGEEISLHWQVKNADYVTVNGNKVSKGINKFSILLNKTGKNIFIIIAHNSVGAAKKTIYLNALDNKKSIIDHSKSNSYTQPKVEDTQHSINKNPTSNPNKKRKYIDWLCCLSTILTYVIEVLLIPYIGPHIPSELVIIFFAIGIISPCVIWPFIWYKLIEENLN